MTKDEISELLNKGEFIPACGPSERIETHISWVILCDQYVYKIKKPLKYSFLDFSTLQKRKYYCEREVELNKRLSKAVYIGVVGISFIQSKWVVSESTDNRAVEYAVKMKRIDGKRRMDILLKKGQVTSLHVKQLVGVLIPFHKRCTIIRGSDHFSVHHNFSDLELYYKPVSEFLGDEAVDRIKQALEMYKRWTVENQMMLKKRAQEGFVRDCHGDLHTRNIFLLDEPIVFDCIEFNDEIRQIDILNELAFFCMDLEVNGYEDLSNFFIARYNDKYPVIRNDAEAMLLIYYKAYRANVRAKVQLLRIMEASGTERKDLIQTCEQYLRLMHHYLMKLS